VVLKPWGRRPETLVSFLGEIKRCKVFQVAAVYAVMAWLIIQVIEVINDPLQLPGWLDTVVIVLLAVSGISQCLLASKASRDGNSISAMSVLSCPALAKSSRRNFQPESILAFGRMCFSFIY